MTVRDGRRLLLRALHDGHAHQPLPAAHGGGRERSSPRFSWLLPPSPTELGGQPRWCVADSGRGSHRLDALLNCKAHAERVPNAFPRVHET